MKPRIFVASSTEALDIAEAIVYNLDYIAELSPWSANIFRLTTPALDTLLEVLETYDFGIFVLTPDDLVVMRKQEVNVPRDNVIFELGLLMGGLGKERCILVVPRPPADLHLPSDLAGVTPATYDPDRSDKNWPAALIHACVGIKATVRKLGRRGTTEVVVESSHDTPTLLASPEPSIIVDQFLNEPPNLGANINEGFSFVAQTYVAGCKGILAGVSLDVHSKRQLNPQRGYPLYRLQISIMSVVAGYPSQIITSTILDTDEALLQRIVTFSDNCEQIPGQSYAIVASYVDAPAHGPHQWIGNWSGCTGNRYSRGNLCYSIDGHTWLIGAVNDHSARFCTLVRPS
jgi:Predicted nucleotide-binding protein containing TIR-like domain